MVNGNGNGKSWCDVSAVLISRARVLLNEHSILFTWHCHMRLWLSKNSEVPIREQLVTQIILGIVSNDLKANERLASTRDLARRYKIHANTVSAALEN